MKEKRFPLLALVACVSALLAAGSCRSEKKGDEAAGQEPPSVAEPSAASGTAHEPAGEGLPAERTAPVSRAAKERLEKAEIRYSGGKLSLRAEGAPLRELLVRVSQETGVKITLYNVRSDSVTDEFTDLPIEPAIKRIAKGYNSVFLYRAEAGVTDSAVPSEVRIISKGGRAGKTRTGPDEYDEGVEEVVSRLERSRDKRDRMATIVELGMIGSPKALDTILPYMIDPDEDIREAAITAAGEIGTEEAAHAIVNSLQAETNEDLQAHMIETLGDMEMNEITSDIIPFLSHKSEDVRESTIDAILALEDPAALPALRKAAERETDDYMESLILDAIEDLEEEQEARSG